jgi:hypothetical protein
MEKCPYCDKNLTFYNDWPLIKVIEFTRQDIPKYLIRHSKMPVDMMGLSREDKQRLYAGTTEFKFGPNFKIEVKKLEDGFCTYDMTIKLPLGSKSKISRAVDPYFERLEQLVGQTITPDKLNAPRKLERKLKPLTLKLEQYSRDKSTPEPDYKEISFDVGITVRDYFNFAAATMKYEGVLLQPNVKP